MIKQTFDPLTPEQEAALAEWIRDNGRSWKLELQGAWCSARAPQPLHRLRNTHGPKWLKDYRAPKQS